LEFDKKNMFFFSAAVRGRLRNSKVKVRDVGIQEERRKKLKFKFLALDFLLR